jgi:hypothetical protein
MFKGIVLIISATLLLGGCRGMSYTEQRILSGGAIGASSGLLIDGLPGAVVGGGAGAVGGYMYNRHQKSDGKP